MLKTYDMRFRKVSAAGRAFWLWFVATALIVLSMAVSPNVAFAADEVQDIPEGVITFVDAGDTDSSPAVVEQEPVVASTSQEEIPEGVVTFDEPEAAEETQDASTNIPVGDPVVVEQEQTAPAQQEATNDQVASNEAPQEGAEQQDAQENAPKQENADNGDKDELASNNSSNDNIQQAVEDEPAINPVQIDEDQATVLDSNEPATQEPIITDAPANAPPTVDTASDANETSVASTDTNNSNITQNANQPVVASSGSSTSTASNANDLHASSNSDSNKPLKAQSDTITVTFVFGGLDEDLNEGGTRFPISDVFKSNTWDGNPYMVNGEIRAPAFQVLAGGRVGTISLFNQTWDTITCDLSPDDMLDNGYWRLGYGFNGGFYVYELGHEYGDYSEYICAGTVGEIADWFDAEFFPDNFDEEGETVTNFTVLMSWIPDPYKATVQYSKTKSESLSGIHIDSDVSSLLPEINSSNASTYGIDFSKIPATYEFAGYVITTNHPATTDHYIVDKGDYCEVGTADEYGEVPVVSAVTSGTYTLRDLYFDALGGKFPYTRFDGSNPRNTYYPRDVYKYPDNHLTMFESEIVLKPVFRVKEDKKRTYQVTYTYVDASGNSTAVTEVVTHGNRDGDTEETAIAKPTPEDGSWNAPSINYYNVEFVGWAISAAAPSEAPTVDYEPGDALSGINGPNTPADEGNYVLYAVWKKIAQKYYIEYDYNGLPGMTNNTVKEERNVSNKTTDKVKGISVLGTVPTGYEFKGWSVNSSGTPLDVSVSDIGTTTMNGLWGTGSPKQGTGNELGTYDNPYKLFAVWSALTYKIKFSLGDPNATSTITIANLYVNDKRAENLNNLKTESGAVATAPNKSNISNTGYIFDGWDSPSGTKVADKDGKLTSDFIDSVESGQTYNFVARWLEVTYTINWYSKWKNGAPDTDQTYNSTTKTGVKISSNGGDLLTSNEYLPSSEYTTETTVAGVKHTWNNWYITTSGSTWTVATATSSDVSIEGKTFKDLLETTGVTVTVNESTRKGTVTIFGLWTHTGIITVTYEYQYSPKTSIGGHSTTVDQGQNYKIDQDAGSYSGWHFLGWEYDGQIRQKGYTINNVQYGPIVITGRWEKNEVKFNLLPGTQNGDSTGIDLKKQADAKANVGDTVSVNTLTTATPTREGYDFAGWMESLNGAVIIGPTASTTIVVPESWAPTDGEVKDLYAKWTPWTYTVRYWTKSSSDTDSANSVVWYKMQNPPSDYNATGSKIEGASYTWAAKTSGSDTGLASPDIILTRKWYNDRDLVKWAIVGSSTAITNSDKLEDLYAQEVAYDNRTNRTLDLYPIWTAITYTVNYHANEHGTVSRATETINLATGKNVDSPSLGIQGSQASASGSGYQLDIPTWTFSDGSAPEGSDTTMTQVEYKPSIGYLRDKYEEVPSSTSIDFYANFTAAQYAYTIQAYMQKADGSWNLVFSKPNDVELTNPGAYTLKAAYNSKVTASDIINGTTLTAINGKPLYEVVLYALQSDGSNNGLSTGGVSNYYLFEFDSSQGKQEIDHISDTVSNNVLKLYYKRTTFDLVSEFKTKDKSGTVTAGAPSKVETSAASHVNNGNATTSLRWGQSVKLTKPTAAGYDFTWQMTAPAGTTASTIVPPTGLTEGSVVITPQGMQALKTATASTNAILTGLFEVQQFKITLNDGLNTMKSWYGPTGSAAADLNTSSKAEKYFASDERLDSWVPNAADDSSYGYYFASWKNDRTGEEIATESLRQKSDWTQPESFTAVWLEKVVITYDPGSNDSAGNSKAAWITTKTSLNGSDLQPPSGSTVQYLANTRAKFATLVNVMDAAGNPKGADGWEFDYWTVSGDTYNHRYGHISAYVGDDQQPDGRYLNGGTAGIDNGISLVQNGTSYTFIAHWKKKTQEVEFKSVGPEVDNSLNDDTITALISNPGFTYGTDDEVDLSDYTPSSWDPGYDFAGWQWKLVDKTTGEVKESGTYAPGTKFHVKNGWVFDTATNTDVLKYKTVVNPYFKEKQYTFTYEVYVESGSSSRGTISPVTTDKVFAVKHNGINPHTANSSNAVAYSFKEWRYNSSYVTDKAEINAERMNIPASEVLDGNRTYYAYFDAIPYTILFDSVGVIDVVDKGTGTVTGSKLLEGSSVTASGEGYNINNGFDVPYNDKIKGALNIVIPEGYELDGWIVDFTDVPALTGTPKVFEGGISQNYQGIYNYTVTKNVKMTAHFKVSSLQKYTVYYAYDPGDPTTGYTGTPASKKVGWGESVLPSSDNPSQAGYTFAGWYIDSARTISITKGDISDDFGTVFNKLGDLNATAPNYDSSTLSITIYAKWSEEKFTVSYDLYGNVEDDNPLVNDDNDPVVYNPALVATKEKVIGWNDLASGFMVDSNTSTFERGGYVFKGWSADYTDESGKHETSTFVLNSDTYGKLAGFNDSHEGIVLHAIWESQKLKVKYIYDDAFAGADAIGEKTETKGWAEKVDYWSLGAAPSTHKDRKFNGWAVEYTITKPLEDAGTKIGETLKASKFTTIRDIVGGNTSAIGSGSTAVVTFTALWIQNSTFNFQDVLVHLDGTETRMPATVDRPVDGGYEVVFADDYGTPKTSYVGYDFDEFTTKNSNHPSHTLDKRTIDPGAVVTYDVYYIERSYTIDFYLNSTDASGTYSTSPNAWNSEPAKLPTNQPSKSGYKFEGWYLTTTNNPDDGVLLDGLTVTIASTSIYKDTEGNPQAPANGSTLKAYAKWSPLAVTIEWDAASNGTTNPAPNSVSVGATDAGSFNDGAGATFIKAVPDTDYVFHNWTYTYTDSSDSTTKTGVVDGTCTFATLGGTNGDELTPVQWVMHTGEDAVWHDIKFTANFRLSTDLTVEIIYYYQDGDKLSEPQAEDRYVAMSPVIETGAKDGEYFNLTPTIREGYSLNEGMTNSHNAECTISGVSPKIVSKKYYVSDPESRKIHVYLDANPYTVTYKYVLEDGTTEDTNPPVGADPLTTFNGGTFVTGQTHAVSSVPTLVGYEFKGWYLSDSYGTPVSGSFSMPAKNVVIVGTWAPKVHTVKFVNARSDDPVSGPAVAANCNIIVSSSSGYPVQYGSKVKTTVKTDANPTLVATKMSDLYVKMSIPTNVHYTITGWEILIDGALQSQTLSGFESPLEYEVTSDVTFRAIWGPTYVVTYTRGAHGAFTDATDTSKTGVEFSDLDNGDPMPQYESKGTLDNGKPDAADGWVWVGWGVQNGSTWTYYFEDDSYIDYGNGTTDNRYGTSNGTHVTTGLPSSVSGNIEYVGFYKALERTLVFSMKEYDKTTGTTQNYADPQPVPADGVETVKTVRTFNYAEMLGKNDIVRAGYELMGWTDGSKTYTPGSTKEFVMPDGPTGQVVYLYPVFSFDTVNITYAVASDQETWGNVDNGTDTQDNPGDPLKGSKPKANPGYEFVKWTKGDDPTKLESADGVQSDNDNKLVPIGASGTVTYYAHFAQKKYNITLVNNESPVGDQETLPSTTSFVNKVWNEDIDLSEDPTRPGYIFTGWDVYDTADWNANHTAGTALRTGIAKDTSKKIYKVSELSDSEGTHTSLTLVPTWRERSYKVIFKDGMAEVPGSGTVTKMPTVNPRNCNFDSYDIIASAPERDGYNFDGWSNSVKGGKVDPGTLTYSDLVNSESDEEVTLTAIWVPISHTLTYQGTDGTWGTDTSKYPAGDPVNAGIADPASSIVTATDATHNLRTGDAITRTGWKLMGWKHGTTEYRFVTGTTLTFTMPDDNVVLTPIWEEAGEFSVHFTPGDGVTDADDMPTKRENIAFSTNDISIHAPKRAGWTFAGWESNVTSVLNPTDSEGKYDGLVSYSYLVNGNDGIKDVILKATWTENDDYRVVFDENAGEDYVSNMPPKNQKDLGWTDEVTIKNMSGDPGRAGYTFDGWTIKDMDSNVLRGTDEHPLTGEKKTFNWLADDEDKPERRTLTLVANWKPKEFIVQFDVHKPIASSGTITATPETNPATGNSSTDTLRNLRYDGEGNVLVPTLTLDGYIFNGWTNSANGNVIEPGTYNYATLAGSDVVTTVTLTADWTANPHYVTYKINTETTDKWSTKPGDYPTTEPADNGVNNPTAAIATETDAEIDLRLENSAIRPGWVLVGWKDTGDPNDETNKYYFRDGKVKYKVPDREVTLTPIFEEKEIYNVIFETGDENGRTKVEASTMPVNRTLIKFSDIVETDNPLNNEHPPVRPGYIFMGWKNSVGADLGDSVWSRTYAQLSGNDASKDTVTLTAKWDKDESYSVTYENGVPDDSAVPYTGPLPANRSGIGYDDDVERTELNVSGLDRVGFLFDGWEVTNAADGSLIALIKSDYSTPIAYSELVGDAKIKSIKFKAKWLGKELQVTYHLTDGSWVKTEITDAGQNNPDDPLTYRCEEDVPLRLAKTVKRDGYDLAGWANGTDKLATGYIEYRFPADVKFSMPAENVDLYPLWDPKTYTVSFVENDTTNRPVTPSTMPTNPQQGEYNDTFTYGEPTRAGYDFGGWDIYKTDEYTTDPATASLLQHVGAGSGTYASLAGSADIDAITMVAYWTPQKLGVTYILDAADNATWVPENIDPARGQAAPNALISYEVDETVHLREANTVSRKGYVLIGWKESNSPSVTTPDYPFDAEGHASFDMPADHNVILYAVWQIKDGYTVTFDPNTPTAPTYDVVPGAVVEDVPDDQPISPAKLTWEGSTSFVDTHSPTFAGYEFKGWDVFGSDGVKINTGNPLIGTGYYFNTLAITDTPEHEHLTLRAVWELARIYNVYFKDGVDAGDTPVTSGTMPSDQTGISYMATVDYHAPSRVGYTFDGWDVLDITLATDEQPMASIDAADAGSSRYYELVDNNVARKKLQLTARWIEKDGYNVHFVEKPASDTGASPVNMGSLSDYINIHWDDTVIAYPAPTRTGYDFVHWAVTDTTDPEDPINIGSATAGSYTYSKLARDRSDDTIMDITLTAIWKAHEWTVTYVNSSDKGLGTWVKANIGDAGKNTPDAPVTYAVDDKITLRDRTTLVMSGYKLIGWQDEEVETANTIKYMLDTVSEFLMPDHDVKLYPIWAPKVYTVIFDGNKPSEATDTSQIVTNLPPTQWTETDDGYPLAWNGDVDTHAPTLAGYSFKGWVIEDASTTGARTGLLNGATYKFSELALTDIMEHETLKLIAQWEPAKYRVNYVDPFDATGAAIATPAMITTDATKLWGDVVSDADPWAIVSPAYTGKSNDDWQFMGWTVLDVNTNTYVALSTIANHAYSSLAKYENVTLADSATADETPALVLYASWMRRVPFVVDFMKRDGAGNDTLEGSQTLVGLDGQIIETTVVDELGKTWKAYVLNTVGPEHGIAGYKYNATLSDPFVVGTLDATAAEPLHVKLIYTQLADYTIVYDAAPGASVSDPSRHTSTKGSLTWEDAGSKFPPNDSEWAYVGHKIVGWTYGPTGVEFDFDPAVKFSDIAEAIYGTVDGSEGRDVDGDGTIEKPVTLFAKWAERTDYKVKYDNNYAVDDGKVKSGITDGRFLERVEDATYTPATKEDVAWSATDIEPTATDDIKKPGVKDGKELYVIDGWNYLSKSGVQKPAEGLSFAEIVADMYDGEPTGNEITLYARYKEIAIEIKYTPVLADDEGNVLSTGASAAGTVSISVETPDVVTGTIQGSTATPNRGYHFVGWRRASDGEILLLNESGTLSGMASKIGYNVLPDGLGGATLLLAAQNTDDGYWHEEEYYALFAQNETAILHYDKNAEDATGSIPDVEAPYETLIDLSDGSGFQRKYWTLVSWNTKADGTGTTYALSQKDWEMPKGETTLYAQWVRNKVKLTYEPGGPDVTGIPEGVEDEWGTKHPVSDQQPKRDHYTFKGWNTKEDGTGIWWKPGDEIELPGDGIHLYAQWEINKYPVSIDPGPYTGGKVTYPDDGTYVVEHGGHLPAGYVTATPEPGYHITGWRYTMTDEYGNVTTGIVSDPTELVVIGKVTFSAIFEADPVDEPMAPYEGYSGNGGLIPQTGDMNLILVLAISGMAAMTLLLLIVAARRRRKEE